jgi:hypothetical protein
LVLGKEGKKKTLVIGRQASAILDSVSSPSPDPRPTKVALKGEEKKEEKERKRGRSERNIKQK